MKTKNLASWFDGLSNEQQRVVAINAVSYLIDAGDVLFYPEGANDDPDTDTSTPYWDSCGERLDAAEIGNY